MSSFICCHVPNEGNRKNISKMIISCPKDFRHISHYGDGDAKLDQLPSSMSGKCGEGTLSKNFHLECIDLKERNGVVLSDISNNEMSFECQKKINGNNNTPTSPPKYPPPPPPSNITYH